MQDVAVLGPPTLDLTTFKVLPPGLGLQEQGQPNEAAAGLSGLQGPPGEPAWTTSTSLCKLQVYSL